MTDPVPVHIVLPTNREASRLGRAPLWIGPGCAPTAPYRWIYSVLRHTKMPRTIIADLLPNGQVRTEYCDVSSTCYQFKEAVESWLSLYPKPEKAIRVLWYVGYLDPEVIVDREVWFEMALSPTAVGYLHSQNKVFLPESIVVLQEGRTLNFPVNVFEKLLPRSDPCYDWY